MSGINPLTGTFTGSVNPISNNAGSNKDVKIPVTVPFVGESLTTEEQAINLLKTLGYSDADIAALKEQQSDLWQQLINELSTEQNKSAAQIQSEDGLITLELNGKTHDNINNFLLDGLNLKAVSSESAKDTFAGQSMRSQEHQIRQKILNKPIQPITEEPINNYGNGNKQNVSDEVGVRRRADFEEERIQKAVTNGASVSLRVRITAQEIGLERWSDKIDIEKFNRQVFLKAGEELGLKREQIEEYISVAKPKVVVTEGEVQRELKPSDFADREFVMQNGDERGRFVVPVSPEIQAGMKAYVSERQSGKSVDESWAIAAATIALPRAAGGGVGPVAMIGVAATPVIITGIYYGPKIAEQIAASERARVLPSPSSPMTMDDAKPTDVAQPTTPDISIPTDEELPKGPLAPTNGTGKPTTTTAPTSTGQPTSPQLPTNGPGKEPPIDPTKIIPPIIAVTTGTVVGVMANRALQTSASHTTPSMKPDKFREPGGIPEAIKKNFDDRAKLSIQRQHESAKLLAQAGYNVEQQPKLTPMERASNPWFKATRDPDFKIEGEIFDCIAPRGGTSVRNIASRIQEKIDRGQTRRIILNMQDSAVTFDELREQFQKYPIPTLEEIIIIKDGNVIPFFPAN